MTINLGDRIAATIRRVDGDHTLSAAALGEAIADDLHNVVLPEPLRMFGPRSANQPNTRPCPACGNQFQAGDYTTIIPLGPGPDPEEQARAVTGRPYTAVGIEAHWVCATGQAAG